MKMKTIAVWALALGLAITPNMAMAAGAEEEMAQIEEAEAVDEEWEEGIDIEDSCEEEDTQADVELSGEEDTQADEETCEVEDTDDVWDGTYMGEDTALPPTDCWDAEDGCGEEMCGMEAAEDCEGEADSAGEDSTGTAEGAVSAEPQAGNGTSGAKGKAVRKADYADSKDSVIAGVYQTVNGAQLYASAGKEDTSLLELDESTEIYCYGYYTGVDGTRWYYVQCSQDGNVITGFCSSEKLK